MRLVGAMLIMELLLILVAFANAQYRQPCSTYCEITLAGIELPPQLDCDCSMEYFAKKRNAPWYQHYKYPQSDSSYTEDNDLIENFETKKEHKTQPYTSLSISDMNESKKSIETYKSPLTSVNSLLVTRAAELNGMSNLDDEEKDNFDYLPDIAEDENYDSIQNNLLECIELYKVLLSRLCEQGNTTHKYTTLNNFNYFHDFTDQELETKRKDVCEKVLTILENSVKEIRLIVSKSQTLKKSNNITEGKEKQERDRPDTFLKRVKIITNNPIKSIYNISYNTNNEDFQKEKNHINHNHNEQDRDSLDSNIITTQSSDPINYIISDYDYGLKGTVDNISTILPETIDSTTRPFEEYLIEMKENAMSPFEDHHDNLITTTEIEVLSETDKVADTKNSFDSVFVSTEGTILPINQSQKIDKSIYIKDDNNINNEYVIQNNDSVPKYRNVSSNFSTIGSINYKQDSYLVPNLFIDDKNLGPPQNQSTLATHSNDEVRKNITLISSNNSELGTSNNGITITKIISHELLNGTLLKGINNKETSLKNNTRNQSPNNNKNDNKTFIGFIIKPFELSDSYIIPEQIGTPDNPKSETSEDGDILRLPGRAIEQRMLNNFSGHLYFLFNKNKIPARFIQVPDGNLNIGLELPSSYNISREENTSLLLTILCGCKSIDQEQ